MHGQAGQIIQRMNDSLNMAVRSKAMRVKDTTDMRSGIVLFSKLIEAAQTEGGPMCSEALSSIADYIRSNP